MLCLALLMALLSASSRAFPIPPVQDRGRAIQVLEIRRDAAYTKFLLPCEVCSGADESLVFNLEVRPFPDEPSITEVFLNGLSLLTSFDGTTEHTRRRVLDTSGAPHAVELQWHATRPDSTTPPPLSWTPRLVFFLSSVDDATVGASGFVVNVELSERPQLLQIGSPFGTTMTDLQASEPGPQKQHMPADSDDESTIMGDEPVQGKDDFDIIAEIESLGLLEAHATVLNKQIADRKKALADQMRQHRESLCLKHLLRECDGLVCKAKAIAQRICDRVGIPTEPDYGYATVKQGHLQRLVGLDEKEGYHKISAGAGSVSHAAHMQIMLTQDGKNYGQRALELSPKNPLVQALCVIAGALGLTALFTFIKRQCMSVRSRVERAADLEERRNARAYRRAARRAEMRRRWDRFVNAINCFSARDEAPHRTSNYDEKRALILQDAFLEQDVDQAEKGEVMEAEIRELRHAHEIVSSLVRVDGGHYALVQDRPPPLVPLPSGRSRASTRASVHTLPSYFSESLPDYSSRPDSNTASSANSIVNDGLDSTTDGAEGGRRTASSITSDNGSNGSRRSRCSPTSSVLDVSPRPSQETLRTRQSRSDC